MWGLAPGGTMTMTDTRSPPTASTNCRRGGMVTATVMGAFPARSDRAGEGEGVDGGPV